VVICKDKRERMAGRSIAREERTRSRILGVLAKNSAGLTISDISRILDLHYTTASKYLAVMEAEKKISHRDIGMAKLFQVKGK
jgi:predicted ArsR family transcriptional regulator